MSISPLPFTQKAKHNKIKEFNTQDKAGSNDYNRLYLQNDCSLRGRSQIPSKHFYVVTQIRRNLR